MANVNNPSGGSIKGFLASADFNGVVNEYIIPASDGNDLFLGDFVKTNNTSENGIPICVAAAAGEVLRGIVVGFKPQSDELNIIYREANTRRVVYVSDDPMIEFEMQASGTIVSTDIGKNADILVGAGSAITGVSGTQLDQSTITVNNAQLKILRILETVNNEIGEPYTKLICMIHEHELAGESGAGTDQHNLLLNLTYDTANHGSGKTGFQRGTTVSNSNPTINSDDTQGYVRGDLWLNEVSKIIFYCADNATGAAIWDAVEAGIHWQEAVKDQVNFTTSEPVGPAINDRYINTTTGVSNVTTQSVTATYIYEWNGTNWSETIPSEGYAVWDQAANEYLIFNGTAWAPLASVQSFLQLSDTPNSYTTANAIYNVNGGATAVNETTTTLAEPSANQFTLTRGTSAVVVTTSCDVDQNISTSSNVAFNQITMTNPWDKFSTDGTLTANLDTNAVSEKAIKTYVDAHTANGMWTRTATNIGVTAPGDNLKLDTAGVFIKSVSSVFDVVAATGITPVQDMVIVVQSSTGGDADITANPQIVAGTNGQDLTLIGNDDTRTVTLDDGTGLALNNGQSFTLGQNDTIAFVFYNSLWIEKSRSDN